MQADSQHWNLFGYDLSAIWRYLRVGWHQLIWDTEAGIRQRLDLPVKLVDNKGEVTRYYQAEMPVPNRASVADTDFTAIAMPADKVLLRTVELPVAIETELEDAMALELSSCSPFPVEAASYGWVVRERQQDKIRIRMALAARSDVDAELASQGYTNPGPADVPEVWVLDDNDMPVILNGFGEQRRYRQYPRRIAWFCAGVAYVLLCALLIAAMPGAVRSIQASQLEQELLQAQQEAKKALAMRERLLLGSERLQALGTLLNEQVDSRAFLEHLSAQTPDAVYLQRVEINEGSARLSGFADNAASYMQVLTEDPKYINVKAPAAFTRDRRTGMERFVLQLDVAVAAGEQ